jgi:hypothetical protein
LYSSTNFVSTAAPDRLLRRPAPGLWSRAAGRAVWFTYDGRSLHSLLAIGVNDDGQLVDIARFVG